MRIYKMPKKPINYQNCVIYKLEHNDDETLLYVGHTTNFIKRKDKHKTACINENNTKFNFKVYQMIRDNGGWDAFKMLEVEKYPCNDKREAERRENEVMKELNANMNTMKSFVSPEERKKYLKSYKEENEEQIKEKNKMYRIQNKDQIKDYSDNRKDIKKDYDKKRRNGEKAEEIKVKRKEFYEKNREMITEKRKEIFKCECGCEVVKQALKRHQATKKHIDLMSKKIVIEE